MLAKLRPALDAMALASVNKAVEQVLTGPTGFWVTRSPSLSITGARRRFLRRRAARRCVAQTTDRRQQRLLDLTYQPPSVRDEDAASAHINAQEPGLSVDHAGTVTFYTGNTGAFADGSGLKIPPVVLRRKDPPRLASRARVSPSSTAPARSTVTMLSRPQHRRLSRNPPKSRCCCVSMGQKPDDSGRRTHCTDRFCWGRKRRL